MSNAKEYLQKIRLYDSRINNSLEELSDLEDMVLRITPVLKDDVVSSSGSQDKLGDTVAKICDLKAQINRDIDTYVDLKREAVDKLKKVEKTEYYDILHKRYVEFQSLEQIAVSMNYTYRWIRRLHGRALQAFEKVMNEGELN
jgi:hypothetical protein